MNTVFLPPISDLGPNSYQGGVFGLHYAEVDEDPHDGEGTTLIISTGGSEHYGIDVSAIPDGSTILEVRVQTAARGTTLDTSSSKSGFRIGGIDYFAPDHQYPPDLLYIVSVDAFPTNPATGLAWTKEVLALAGLRHAETDQPGGTPRPHLSQLVAFADIVPPVIAPPPVVVGEPVIKIISRLVGGSLIIRE